jgi:hypothetical protein
MNMKPGRSPVISPLAPSGSNIPQSRTRGEQIRALFIGGAAGVALARIAHEKAGRPLQRRWRRGRRIRRLAEAARRKRIMASGASSEAGASTTVARKCGDSSSALRARLGSPPLASFLRNLLRLAGRPTRAWGCERPRRSRASPRRGSRAQRGIARGESRAGRRHRPCRDHGAVQGGGRRGGRQ